MDGLVGGGVRPQAAVQLLDEGRHALARADD